MPHPSTGCQTCKNRRIKCDGAKPTCQRCTKSQRLCVESIDTKRACLSIHSENLYASGKTKRPRGPRSSLTLFRPNSDLPSRAVAYYLNYYLGTAINLPTVSACMSECLTSWKASGRESGMVDLAISSLALAIFSRTQKHRPAAREAFKAYGRLLSVAKEEITQAKILTRWPEGIDECLLTVVLMGWYETTMHKLEYFGPKDAIAPMHSWSHYDGAMAILRAWNMRYNAPSSVVKQARRGIIRLALLRSYQLPDWILDGHRFGERSIDLSFDKLLVQAVNLHHALKCHKVKKSLHAPMSEHLEHQARELDEASQDWAGQIPSAWSYRPLDLAETSQWSRVDFYSSTIYCCTNPGYATVWINYFTIRMIILSTYVGLLKLDPPSEFIGSASGKKRFACSIQLKEMADSLASTVPFCLGRFELSKSHDLDTANEPTVILKTNERILPALALPVVWPMSMASGLDGVEPAQQLWFSTQLARLGQVLGDGALECAGTDQWRHEL